MYAVLIFIKKVGLTLAEVGTSVHVLDFLATIQQGNKIIIYDQVAKVDLSTAVLYTYNLLPMSVLKKAALAKIFRKGQLKCTMVNNRKSLKDDLQRLSRSYKDLRMHNEVYIAGYVGFHNYQHYYVLETRIQTKQSYCILLFASVQLPRQAVRTFQ